MNFKNYTSLSILSFFLVPSAWAQIIINFESGTELSTDFRHTGGYTAGQSSNGAANDYLFLNRDGASNTGSIYLYDTTPMDATSDTQSTFSTLSPVTVSMDFRLADSGSSGSSLGVYFVDPANVANNIMVLFNVDASGATDRFRHFLNGNLSTIAAGTQVGDTTDSSTGVNAGDAFSSLNVELSFSEGDPVLTTTVGSQTVSQAFTGVTFLNSGTVIGLRMYDGTNNSISGVEIDNLSITSIPEPSFTATLLGFAVAGLCLARMKTRRN